MRILLHFMLNVEFIMSMFQSRNRKFYKSLNDEDEISSCINNNSDVFRLSRKETDRYSVFTNNISEMNQILIEYIKNAYNALENDGLSCNYIEKTVRMIDDVTEMRKKLKIETLVNMNLRSFANYSIMRVTTLQCMKNKYILIFFDL